MAMTNEELRKRLLEAGLIKEERQLDNVGLRVPSIRGPGEMRPAFGGQTLTATRSVGTASATQASDLAAGKPPKTLTEEQRAQGMTSTTTRRENVQSQKAPANPVPALSIEDILTPEEIVRPAAPGNRGAGNGRKQGDRGTDPVG